MDAPNLKSVEATTGRGGKKLGGNQKIKRNLMSLLTKKGANGES